MTAVLLSRNPGVPTKSWFVEGSKAGTLPKTTWWWKAGVMHHWMAAKPFSLPQLSEVTVTHPCPLVRKALTVRKSVKVWKREKSQIQVEKLFASHGMPKSLHAKVSILVFLYKGQPLAVTPLLKHPRGGKKNVVLCVVRVNDCLLCFSMFFVYLSPRLPTRSWESYLGFHKYLTLPIFARLFQQGGVRFRFTTLPRGPTFPCKICGSNEIWLFHVTSGQRLYQIKETPLQFSFHIAAATVQGTCEYDFAFWMSHPAPVSFMEDSAIFPNPNAGAVTDWHTRSARLCLNTSPLLLLCILSLT